MIPLLSSQLFTKNNCKGVRKMKKEYICECGKIFNNPQSFNGHKGHCKAHQLDKYGNLDKYNANHDIFIKSARKGAKQHSIKCKNKKVEELTTWIEEKHTCEHCGKLMTTKFGSGRFCSRECANSRIQTDVQNSKRREKLKGIKYYSNGETTIGVKPSEDIPEGFCEGNFSLSKLSFNAFKNKKLLSSTHIKRKTRKLSKVQALNYNSGYIESHNTKVLQEYEKLLENKAKNKTFYINENDILMYGQYKAISKPDHPRTRSGRVFIHVLMAEELIGRYLTSSEIVHHKNENKLDNRFDNLYIFKSQGDHARFHFSKYYWLKIENDALICEKIDFEKLDNNL